jgi:hypothetical protein
MLAPTAETRRGLSTAADDRVSPAASVGTTPAKTTASTRERKSARIVDERRFVAGVGRRFRVDRCWAGGVIVASSGAGRAPGSVS